jgi:hypothetical protein
MNTLDRPSKCCADGCKKKLTLLDFACKCEKYHCPAHRHAEQHGCSYDYKQGHRDILLKYMSTPVSSKKVEIV